MTRSPRLPRAVKISTGVASWRLRISLSTSRPSASGRPRSSTTISNRLSHNAAVASFAVGNTSTTNPAVVRPLLSSAAKRSLSSTSNSRIGLSSVGLSDLDHRPTAIVLLSSRRGNLSAQKRPFFRLAVDSDSVKLPRDIIGDPPEIADVGLADECVGTPLMPPIQQVDVLAAVKGWRDIRLF